MEIKQCIPEQPKGERRNQKGNILKATKWKYTIPKLMGCNKSKSKKAVNAINVILIKRKISNKILSLYFKKPVGKTKKIQQIRGEINEIRK